MNRMSKWIQERKAYSNPLFGAMLIVSGMIFPVFQASAAIAQPVQPMAQTSQQVVDALNAVQAGATVNQAFGIQPVPYREWVKSQRTIYEALFQTSYTLADSDYFLISSISLADERTTVQGQNALGELYNLELVFLTKIENTGSDIPDDIANFLASVNADDYAFTGTISTDNASFHIAGSIFQADLPDGSRTSFLVIGSTVDSTIIDILNDPARDAPSFLVDGPVPQTCEQAFAIADNNYTAAWTTATAAYNGCMSIASIRLRNGLIGCGLAAALVWASGIAGLIALGAGFACAIVILTNYDSDIAACFTALKVAVLAARAARTAAQQNAIEVFGEGNCPTGGF